MSNGICCIQSGQLILEIHLLDTLSNKFVPLQDEEEFGICKITMEQRVFSSYKNLYI